MFVRAAVNSMIDNDSVAVMCLGVRLLNPGELHISFSPLKKLIGRSSQEAVNQEHTIP